MTNFLSGLCPISPASTNLGEVLALRWCDTHLREGEGFLSVTRSLAKSTDGWGFKEPKSRSGRRRITLPQLTLKALSDHRQWQDNEWRELHDLPVISGDAVVPLPGREFAYPADGLVFSAEAGEVLSPNAVSKAFAKLVGQLNIKQVTDENISRLHKKNRIYFVSALYPRNSPY